MIVEELDCQSSQQASCPRLPKKEGNEKKDEALTISAKPKKGLKPKGSCWNCRESSHFKNKCPKPRKEGPSVNTALPDSDDKAAFFMELLKSDVELSDCESNFSSLIYVSTGESDWETEELSGVNWSETSSLVKH